MIISTTTIIAGAVVVLLATVDMPFHCDTAILFVYVQDFFGICDLC